MSLQTEQIYVIVKKQVLFIVIPVVHNQIPDSMQNSASFHGAFF